MYDYVQAILQNRVLEQVRICNMNKFLSMEKEELKEAIAQGKQICVNVYACIIKNVCIYYLLT